MELYYFIVFYLFGTIFGSFYNVVGYRLPLGKSILYPESHCPNCKHKLTPLELIPIISYFIQGGKCKKCKKHIPIFYPMFEFITGILFAISYLIFGLTLNYLLALIFISTLIIVVISDYQTMIISDEVIIASVILMTIVLYLIGGFSLASKSLLDGTAAFLFMFGLKLFGDFLFKKEAMGGGDIKLLFVFGMYLGFPMAIISIFAGSVIGLPISLIILYKKHTNIIPFGPFLSAGALLIALFKIDFNFIIKLLS